MRRVLVAAAIGIAVACGSDYSGPTFTPTTSVPTAVLIGAGDIGECGSGRGSEETARILDRNEGIIFTAGDNAYPSGRSQDFRSCYETTWGRHRARTRPSPGNHDYETAGGGDYYNYYSANAGPFGMGYYSFNAGAWTVYSLNSNIPIENGSAQLMWLRNELANHAAPCSAAIFHHSPFSSGPHGDHGFLRDVWREMTDGGVDVVIAAHDHLYERFAPMDRDGRADAAFGTRLFVVGTGGAQLSPFMRVAPNSEVRISQFGVIKLSLSQNGYRWEFLQSPGGVGDSGAGACH